MNLGTRVRGAAIAAGVLVLAAGCTTSSADGPTSTAIVSVTASPSVVDPSTFLPSSSVPSPSTVESSPLAPPSADISPQEAADRAAIEAQWTEFWSIYTNIVRTPADQRSAVLDSVSIDPAKSKVLSAASKFEADGLDYYGNVILRPYSIQIDSVQGLAILEDCQDQSGYGSVYVSSGKKRTVGVSDNHTQAGLVRGSDGIWRVQNVQYPTNVPC